MINKDRGSFRDPSGFIFVKSGQIFRQINKIYFPQFERLIKSGLYRKLCREKLLVKHTVKERREEAITIQPEKIPFISYPYEWSFNMLKAAAMLTLKIQEIALRYQMVLKDASAFNVQFIGAKPVFIDTLSFDIYQEGDTWVAYKQFCQHFLAPLSLMSQKDLRANLLMRQYIDGIPLDLASKLLPWSSKLNMALLSHIHLHAANQKRMADRKVNFAKFKMSKFQMMSLIKNLQETVDSLKIGQDQTEWEDYYAFTNYSKKAAEEKHEIVKKYLRLSKAKTVLDLGANNGEFSKLAVESGAYTIACDSDSIAIDLCYTKNQKNLKLLPLIIDLTNPSPALGWANDERKSFTDRFQTDLVLALALIHHLCISNNLPFESVANYLSKLGKYLIIEFVPKNDSKVQKLLQNRKDVFTDYSQESFEMIFKKYFVILGRQKIKQSARIIYFLKRK